MTVFEAIGKRYSCRSYLDRPVEPEKLSQVFEAARLAPSARNVQDWRFVVITEQELKSKIAHAANDQNYSS